jgi:hypothetical protein
MEVKSGSPDLRLNISIKSDSVLPSIRNGRENPGINKNGDERGKTPSHKDQNQDRQNAFEFENEKGKQDLNTKDKFDVASRKIAKKWKSKIRERWSKKSRLRLLAIVNASTIRKREGMMEVACLHNTEMPRPLTKSLSLD